MANADRLIELTNRVKLAAIALADANRRRTLAEQASTAAREEASEAGSALAAAERLLLREARQSEQVQS